MVLLCFLLDLRTLMPPLLKEIKQCLLQLANLYAISKSELHRKDKIGICYIHKTRVSSSNELKIAYSPRGGDFSLRDFHHAVSNIPSDAFLPESIGSGVSAASIDGGDVALDKLLSEEVLYSWGGKDIVKKVIFIGSCILKDVDSVRKILNDAADKCVSVEFVLLEQERGASNDASRNVQDFLNSISDLENCSLRNYLPDTWILNGLVKRWLQELKDTLEEPLQAAFLFKDDLAGSTDRILCNLFTSAEQIIDSFSPCQTCRCHGLPLEGSSGIKCKRPLSCSITCQELTTSDMIDNAVKVGDHTRLFLPSFQTFPELQQVSAPINFNVIERTNLGSLNEGSIIGSSYVVTPLASHEDEATSDESNKSELNTKFFQGLCQALHSLDQGLVCSSTCNMETMRTSGFQCFYILQPSDNGPMLLRRLAGSEEILPFPESIRSIDYAVPKDMLNSIQTSLLKMPLRDYNPLFHERGLHQKLNLLVKESLQFGSIPPRRKESYSEISSLKHDPSEMTLLPASAKKSKEEHSPQLTQAIEIDDSTDRLTEEWEQLIVNEDCKIYSPTSISMSNTKRSALSPVDVNKQLGEKTSRILERLEAPRQSKTKGSSPVVVSSTGADACMPKKRPLLPFTFNSATDHKTSSSQPMKPNFQRLKRKPM